jgi:hypothetical protein
MTVLCCRLVTTFNESITKLLDDETTRDTANARLNQRPTRKMLKHIIQQVYLTQNLIKS